jgi:predicted TPR repeat methyltransferase
MYWEKIFWDNRYNIGGNSGYGSYNEQLEKKLKWIGELKDIKTISEFGCGDFNFGKRILDLFPTATYKGWDISQIIVDKNKLLFPAHTFNVGQETEPADLVLCVDVLFHVIYKEEYEEILNKLEKAWTKYLVITAYERDEELGGHVRIRKFDYTRFGTPLVREVVEENGSLYFYVFKRPTPDYKRADELRKQINDKGYEVEDTPNGPRIYKK